MSIHPEQRVSESLPRRRYKPRQNYEESIIEAVRQLNQVEGHVGEKRATSARRPESCSA